MALQYARVTGARTIAVRGAARARLRPRAEGVSVVGAIVGTRKDLQETLELAARGLVRCNYTAASMEEINDVFGEMRASKIDGRAVLKVK